MVKVITYGTFDHLHYGHERLLKRAKALGDYLIVGVTSDDFDRRRGKINVNQNLMERIEAVRELGIADKIIVEEYEGQKIDDIKRYEIDIFTVGSDWVGAFDYLNKFCEVKYLDRTEGVSSTEIRTTQKNLKMGIVGEDPYLEKFYGESKYVNGLEIKAIYTTKDANECEAFKDITIYRKYDDLLDAVEAIYVHSYPSLHYKLIKQALKKGKHVLCEAPITIRRSEYEELRVISETSGCILMDSIRTAFSTAYDRLLLLIKSGMIGDIKLIDATCTSLRRYDYAKGENWNSICAWGPNAMLPIFQILGTGYNTKYMVSKISEDNDRYDLFTKIDFIYPNAVASIKVGQGVKAEGEMIISGTKGYIYIPAPWWKTDYFEVRFENQDQNKRYFYQLEGEGIRYELVAFRNKIINRNKYDYIEPAVSLEFISVIEDFYNKKDIHYII